MAGAMAVPVAQRLAAGGRRLVAGAMASSSSWCCAAMLVPHRSPAAARALVPWRLPLERLTLPLERLVPQHPPPERQALDAAAAVAPHCPQVPLLPCQLRSSAAAEL